MSGLTLRGCLLLVALIPLGVCSGTAAAQALPAQSSNQSGVTVKVTPLKLQGPVWEFEAVFDTHSQELKDDLLKNAVLVAADGKQVAPLAWQGDPPSGHHRKGVLRFNALQPAPSTVVLRISRPGEAAPRSFEWKLK